MKKITVLPFLVSIFMLFGCNAGKRSSNKKVLTFDEFHQKAKQIDTNANCQSANVTIHASIDGSDFDKMTYHNEVSFTYEDSVFKSGSDESQVMNIALEVLNMNISKLESEEMFINGIYNIASAYVSESSDIKYQYVTKYYATDTSFTLSLKVDAEFPYLGLDMKGTCSASIKWNEHGYIDEIKASLKASYSGYGEKGSVTGQATALVTYL